MDPSDNCIRNRIHIHIGTLYDYTLEFFIWCFYIFGIDHSLGDTKEPRGSYKRHCEQLQSNYNSSFSCKICIGVPVYFHHLFFRPIILHYSPCMFAHFACDQSYREANRLSSWFYWAEYDRYFVESDLWYEDNFPGSILMLKIVWFHVRVIRWGNSYKSSVHSQRWRTMNFRIFKSISSRLDYFRGRVILFVHCFNPKRSCLAIT